MLATIIFIFLVIATVPFLINLALGGKDQSAYDLPKPPTTGQRKSESDEHKRAAQVILDEGKQAQKLSKKAALQFSRQQLDKRGLQCHIDANIEAIQANDVNAEWVMAPNVDSKRRVLYIHGGAYMLGSPQSHRLITSRLSKIANAAVLAVDFRLMPEYTRISGIKDCRKTYEWVLKNGPDGKSDADILIVAGDSSGGNMALSTIAWARDSGLRAADAVLALSPQTDLTLSSPSLVKNIDTDVMLGGSYGALLRAPKFVSLCFSYYLQRMNPKKPLVSPLLGNLSNLPPTLIQASQIEMLLDDAIRYVNKANASGSTAVIQTWPFVMHVWQAFEIPEADEAFTEIKKFLSAHT